MDSFLLFTQYTIEIPVMWHTDMDLDAVKDNLSHNSLSLKFLSSILPL